MTKLEVHDTWAAMTNIIDDYLPGFDDNGPMPRVLRLKPTQKKWCLKNLSYEPYVDNVVTKKATSVLVKGTTLQRFIPAEEYYTISFNSERDALLFKTFWL